MRELRLKVKLKDVVILIIRQKFTLNLIYWCYTLDRCQIICISNFIVLEKKNHSQRNFLSVQNDYWRAFVA